jgi:hypothetical protein
MGFRILDASATFNTSFGLRNYTVGVANSAMLVSIG